MKKIIYIIAAAILFALGNTLLKSDFLAFLQWWVTIAYIGVIFMPLTTMIFQKFHDRGYLFSKSIGIAMIGYLMWFLSSIRVLKFTPLSCVLCVGISIAFNVLIQLLKRRFDRENHRAGVADFLFKEKALDTMISEELVFFALLLVFCYIRGFKPDVYGSGGTEKFMDYGFMTSMMRSEYMPPQDFWFSGTSLNYYYVGQYLATFLTKLSRVGVSVTYNLMLMTLGVLAVMLPYSLVYNLVTRFMQEREKKGRLVPAISGGLAGIAVCIAGNMHYPTYQWFEPLVRKFFGMEASTDKYWFPDATRFIGYHPETTDKTIHEFPSYSFVLGDLHAHVINIMFVLTVIAILFAWSCSRRDKKEIKLPLWKEMLNPAIIMISFFIGLFHTTNYWDFPIYYVVSGAVILFTNLIVYNFKGKEVALVTALQGGFVLVVSTVIALPFTMNFEQISTNICLAVNHTPLNQLIILWGLPIFMVIAFLCFAVSDFTKQRRAEPGFEQRKHSSLFADLFRSLSSSDLFILTLGLCAIGLILIPEVIYIQDIYSGDYKRANTMFKLTYQAFIMFGVSYGYIFLRLLWFGTTKRQKKVAATGLILFALSLCYIQNAVNSWYGNIFDMKSYEGLDSTAHMVNTMPDDNLAITWLNENVTGTPVVLEAPGDSYTDYERVSVMTGLPTVLGWHTHEWLWKSDTTLLDARAADIQLIYTSTDEAEVQSLLKKYDISYIYVGKLEKEKYPDINHEMLKSLGETVFISPADGTKDYETYIIKVKND
jgi:uncharacterized membrane protein